MSGRHMAFPFQIGTDGRTATPATLPDHVKGEVVQLLLTNEGERPFMPEFGGGLRRMVFEGNDDYTAAVAKARISQALTFWLQERLELLELEVKAENAIFSVTLKYRVIDSGEEQLVRFEHGG